MGRIYVALDLETTGLDPENDRIIEIGAVKFRVADQPDEEDEVLDSFQTFVNPYRKLARNTINLTGITQKDVANAPPLEAVLPELERFVGYYPVVGHNIGFDLRFLQAHGALEGAIGVDTFELAGILLPDAPRYSLGKLAEYLGIEFPTRHRALDDADMSRQLFLALWERAWRLPPDVLQAIVSVAQRSDWRLRSFFAAALRRQGIGGGGPRQIRERPPIPPALTFREGAPPVRDIARLEAFFAPDGPLAQTFETFEPRPQQVAMMKAVAQAFNRGQHLLVEAGTGTGKSLAYLLPAVEHAVQAQEPVIVSTNTINLQEQLFHKDLPRLQQAFDKPFRIALLKGRANYICPRRFRDYLQRERFSEAEARLMARLLVWLPNTTTGDRSELLIQRDEQKYWPYICADQHACRSFGCGPHTDCFFYRARAQAQGAHIVVINHALLLADAAMDNAILPEHRYVIVDEAHHLEDRATEHFGGRVHAAETRDFLHGLVAQPQNGAPGVFRALARLLREDKTLLPDEQKAPLRRLTEELMQGIQQAAHHLDRMFESIELAIQPHTPRRGEYDAKIRLLPDVRDTAAWHHAVQDAQEAADTLTRVMQGIDRLTSTLDTLLEDLDLDRWSLVLNMLYVTHAQIEDLAFNLQRIVIAPDENDVCWVRVNTRWNRLELNRAPLHVGTMLAENVFGKRRSVVLTSATLQSDGGFQYIRDRLGVPHAAELAVGSPFNYREMALVYVATDLPEPNSPNYARALAQSVMDLARATEGRMLVLCTSKTQLRRLYEAIADPLARDEITVIAQYFDGSRHTLVERFKATERTVLLGTQSFWEGVDIPGEALSCLVITRLPFPVPSEPIIAARAETYDNAFYQYTIPQTILRFRQGFGRLIRSQEDHGIVAIFDGRVASKAYGQHFLNALPECEIVYGPARDLPPLAERWLHPERLFFE